jgi:agmatinase
MAFDPNAPSQPGAGIYGLSDDPESARVVLVPVPWDATTSYRSGTSKGPSAILRASQQVDLLDAETGKPYLAGIAMLPENARFAKLNEEARAEAESVIAAGGAHGNDDLVKATSRVNELSEEVNGLVFETVRAWLERGKIVGLVGGDHASPFGSIQAHAQRHPDLGILHFDAHADLRRAYEGFEHSHASIMENVTRRIPEVARLVQIGIRDFCEEELERIRKSKGRIETFFDVRIAKARMQGRILETFGQVVEALPKNVYVSFDVDGLDPSLCPHTGTPVAGGLSLHEASMLIGMVVDSGRRIVGFDLNEVAPSPDESDEWDANVGARLLYKLIGWTLLSQGIGERPGIV